MWVCVCAPFSVCLSLVTARGLYCLCFPIVCLPCSPYITLCLFDAQKHRQTIERPTEKGVGGVRRLVYSYRDTKRSRGRGREYCVCINTFFCLPPPPFTLCLSFCGDDEEGCIVFVCTSPLSLCFSLGKEYEYQCTKRDTERRGRGDIGADRPPPVLYIHHSLSLCLRPTQTER